MSLRDFNDGLDDAYLGVSSKSENTDYLNGYNCGLVSRAKNYQPDIGEMEDDYEEYVDEMVEKRVEDLLEKNPKYCSIVGTILDETTSSIKFLPYFEKDSPIAQWLPKKLLTIVHWKDKLKYIIMPVFLGKKWV